MSSSIRYSDYTQYADVNRRPYDASNRARQARETRRRIVEAARGALRARRLRRHLDRRDRRGGRGRGPDGLRGLRNKAGILRAVVELTVRGDDDAAPLAARAAWQEIEAEEDPRQRLRRFASLHREICDREAAVFAQLEAAAGADAEATGLLAEHDARRYETQRRLARALHRRGSCGPA